MRIFFTISLLVLGATVSVADPGHPAAIIRLPSGSVAIESMWNLSVVMTDAADDLGRPGAGVDVVTGAITGGQDAAPNRFRAPLDSLAMTHVMDRQPNQPKATWTPLALAKKRSPNAMEVHWHDGAIIVTVDDVKVVYLFRPGNLGFANQKIKPLVQNCDALVFHSDAQSNVAEIVRVIEPKRVILASAEGFDEAKQVDGNTLAISSESPPKGQPWLVLTATAKQLPAEVTELIERKEAACEASQQVFAKLSPAQLNFRPSNGSHTPRWNAEHMMGRELLFFSQIFHARDAAIPIMNLNPKQMPPDYQAKHPDWNGQEEAMQMERVSAFTRRFAYLLDGLPLDRKAPGSSWTPRRLLLQMDRHYSDHTANVKKKFELPDWPKK